VTTTESSEPDDFAARLAAPTPTPGGGAAAARCGLYATALLRMVASISLEKSQPGELDDRARRDVEQLDSRARSLGETFRRLEAADVAAFDAWIAALRLPKKSDDEKEARRIALLGAAREATEVPIATATTARDVLRLAGEAVELGRRVRLRAESDVGVAVEIANAALRAADWNVAVNLPALGAESSAWAARSNEIQRSGRALVEELRPRILAWISAPAPRAQ
jgi:formiminotetrahydrofolate cyclodeaminase